jgi:hypothetical protein
VADSESGHSVMSEQDDSMRAADVSDLPESPHSDTPNPTIRSAHPSAMQEPPAEPYHLLPDLYRGVVRGAYAAESLHTPGMLAWITMGFVPGLGTVFAMRDGYYCLEVRDWGGFLLNLFGLLPFMKGFSNIIDVAFAHRVHRMAHTTHQVLHATRHERVLRAGSRRSATILAGGAHGASDIVIAVRKDNIPSSNRSAWPAILLALVTASLSPLIMVLLLGAITGFPYFGSVLPLPLAVGSGAAAVLWSLGILALAIHARRTARKMRGQPFSRSVVSLVAVWLASFGLLVCIVSAAFVFYLELGALINH